MRNVDRQTVVRLCLAAGLLFLAACGNNERRAAENWKQALAQEKSDRKSAIALAEELIVTYSRTEAAAQARAQVPYWIHAEFYGELAKIGEEITASSNSQNVTFIRDIGDKLSGPQLARPLVRILEDYPGYELFELVEMQVVAMAMWRPLVRAVLVHRIWNEEIKKKTEEAIRFEGPYDEMLKKRVELVAEMLRGFKKVMLEMANGIREAAAEMEQLSKKHSQRAAFVEGGEVLRRTGRAAEEFAKAMEGAIEFYEDDAFECSQAQNSISDGFFSNLGRSWTLRGCKKSQEDLEEQFRPASKELKMSADEIKVWLERSKLGAYTSQLAGLDRLGKAIGGG